MIKEKGYSKINLSLNIINKREDGFHNIDSIMLNTSLYDELTFEECDDIIIVDDSGINFEDNIVYKTALLLKYKFDIQAGVKITIEKNIPIEGGLAGGSADCAAAFRGLNTFWNLGLSLDELGELALMLGSDTYFCVYERPSIVTGRGDKLDFIESNLKCNILIVKPDFGLSTKLIFENHVFIENKIIDNSKLLQSLKDNNIDGVIDNINNDLYITAINVSEELQDASRKLQIINPNFKMSGSGSTFFLLYDDKNNIDDIIKKIPSSYKFFMSKIM